jgi:hypothetical protein
LILLLVTASNPHYLSHSLSLSLPLSPSLSLSLVLTQQDETIIKKVQERGLYSGIYVDLQDVLGRSANNISARFRRNLQHLVSLTTAADASDEEGMKED